MVEYGKEYIYIGEPLVSEPESCRYYDDDSNIQDDEALMPKYDKLIPIEMADTSCYSALHVESGITIWMGTEYFETHTKLAYVHRKNILKKYKEKCLKKVTY